MNFYLWIQWLRQKKKARYGHVLLIIEKFCFCLFCPTREFFTYIWKRHNGRWRAANFDLCSALMAIEQRVFFSVPPHLLWHEASVYNGQLRRPATLKPITERLATTYYLFLRLRPVEAGYRTPNLPLARPSLPPTVPLPRFDNARSKSIRGL